MACSRLNGLVSKNKLKGRKNYRGRQDGTFGLYMSGIPALPRAFGKGENELPFRVSVEPELICAERSRSAWTS